MRQVLNVLVENQCGVLARVAGLFSGRGFNIKSLSVAETLDPTLSIMTIVTEGDERVLEQITKQLNRLIPVVKVIEVGTKPHVERELILVKVDAKPENRGEILRIVEIFRGKIVDVSPKTYTIEMTGDEEKINAFLELLKPIGIKEMARSGLIALTRG
jgi:acetolactate synthase-1/3 small subunit